MKTIPQTDWARLAAFIDGEGCIQIHRQRQYSKKAQPNWRPHYIVQVVITNTDPRLMVWCKDTFGGFVVSSDRGKNKRYYKWCAHSKACAELLTNCLPYFIIKRAQAEIAIAFRKTYSKEYVGRGRSVPDSVIAHRDLLTAELKQHHGNQNEIVN